MDDAVRTVARAIAAAWWIKKSASGATGVPEATSPTDYAETYWQSFREEAVAALAAMEALRAQARAPRIGSDRFS